MINLSFYSLVIFVFFSRQPEWYFTQVLTWIRDHCDFLEKSIQPLLEEETNGRVVLDARVGKT